jgi:hypothetical protein
MGLKGGLYITPLRHVCLWQWRAKLLLRPGDAVICGEGRAIASAPLPTCGWKENEAGARQNAHHWRVALTIVGRRRSGCRCLTVAIVGATPLAGLERLQVGDRAGPGGLDEASQNAPFVAKALCCMGPWDWRKSPRGGHGRSVGAGASRIL